MTEFTQRKAKDIIDEVTKVIVGQYELIEYMTVALLAGGHVLLEGVPGLGKTLAARTMSKVVKGEFKRIQFTPDLMPADITGTKVYDIKDGIFYIKKGPVFTNILLADEINRTPPKTQAALLEAMEEKSITIDGETFKLAEPFMVVATQNPVEYEGTYPLPEAQLDRFMMKLHVGYMPQKFENILLKRYDDGFDSSNIENTGVQAVCDAEDIEKCRDEIKKVRAEEGIINYITSLVRATRNSPALMLGASPRASVYLLLAAKTYAAMQGRDYITPDDVKDMALPLLRHRIVVRPEVGIDDVKNDDIITNILSRIEVPR